MIQNAAVAPGPSSSNNNLVAEGASVLTALSPERSNNGTVRNDHNSTAAAQVGKRKRMQKTGHRDAVTMARAVLPQSAVQVDVINSSHDTEKGRTSTYVDL